MIGHDQRAFLVVETDIGRIRPRKRVLRVGCFPGGPAETSLLGPIRSQDGDLAGAGKRHVQFARRAKGESVGSRTRLEGMEESQIAVRRMVNQRQAIDRSLARGVEGNIEVQSLALWVNSDAVRSERSIDFRALIPNLRSSAAGRNPPDCCLKRVGYIKESPSYRTRGH